jgi:hypothetical protein
LIILSAFSGIGCQQGESESEETQEVELSTPTAEDLEKQEALNFSLRFVQTYFVDDCQNSLDFLSDTLISLSSYELVRKMENELGLCEAVGKAIEDNSRDFSDYERLYLTTIRSKTEMDANYPDALPSVIIEGDYFFDGHHLKEDVDPAENFIWGSAFILMIRKENGQWKVKGFGV